ncbi:DNA-directed RNA polymerase sigma-70 factor [Marivirga tractuosa]|uniref:RNA polymerase, sigma-24 subunit, ECF subfamily n=1 Tax=Marivirga tractuosa (strain ATCC 23168 / DSM 4126 / NBRC 15989 / NCIMB 1408 / VKM B-1430 / H-43) TaxID=643867 RepID=E4TUY3_MARTH|nr:sigma-70 family RNA polymerase sigma factor [Marivirga tractuosa]ADR21088.1 RNA polymerase, sigma-24 subunit, ECF subfamily [Marivirga tractuosa DSM 4126]BDD14457.1 DNA-directed RNA polymerase sigma-70 factor [Marivirga tractuosa]
MKNSSNLSFEQVIEDNKAAIYRICKVYATTPVEPEDLFQEVTVHIWKAFSNFDGRAKISTWIYRIALNVCMRYKSRIDNSKSNMIRLDTIVFQIPAAIPDVSVQEKFNALYDCIRLLNEIDQSIAILILDELPYKEIANITGLSENHIAVKMKRMKKVLLNCINSKL